MTFVESWCLILFVIFRELVVNFAAPSGRGSRKRSSA